jgi:hypothetical protein
MYSLFIFAVARPFRRPAILPAASRREGWLSKPDERSYIGDQKPM